ncbi:MAG TPA: aldo/keto reductase, partial [Thermoanaerobaculia bacterium]|nr:aldo/keto reductase [Thermoanaerobaculia bacterium]
PGYSVPRVIHGAWQLSAGHRGAAGAPDREEAVQGLLRLAEAGFDTFDCADIYTGVEELLGEVLRAWRRRGGERPAPELRVHTKLVPDLAALPDLDRGYVERVVERSLRRLGVERLDLVQLHWWDWSIPGYVEAAGWLDDLRRAGKVRLVGVTNFDAERLAEVLDAGVPVVSNQVQHSLLDRRPEGALAELAERRGVALLGYGALAGGFLTDRWLGAPEPPSPAKAPATALPNRSLAKYRLILDEFGPWRLFQDLLQTLARIGRRHDAPLAAVALRAALDRPGAATAVLGATGARHLPDTLRALDLPLDDHDRAALEAVLARAQGPTGPVYALERDPTGPHAAIMRYDLNRV